MAVGRITGPLLASNLLRDGVNLAVETNLLYLDVTTGRIGVKTAAPQFELDVNGTINSSVLKVSNTSTLGLITVTKSLTSGTIASTLGPINVTPAAGNSINLNSNVEVGGNLHATGNITADGNIQLGDTTATDTLLVGAEIISNLIPKIPNTFNIGSESNNWKDGYFEQMFAGNTKLYGNTLTNYLPGNIDITPKNGVVNIHGDIRVWGKSPLGTSPQTTNVLYVNEDGSDTNDGGAMDPSRACRTISAAVKSPLYKPGTSIKVASGHYLENNPIEMKPYTSVIGSDLRTTIIEPINKTQDLFHVRSGCYVAQLMMYNGRSGRFPGTGYKSDTNRGAYATAFPPQGDNGVKIDLFHSPYIQNCTNQSGPWLFDGTMFVPNQTVQIPEGVGISTWDVGAQEITVTLDEGTIYTGQSINGGPPTTGFFNARTLLLANKSFVQEQVVAYVDETYGGQFQYDSAKCARDTGLIVDGLGLDLIYEGSSQSVFSGLQYWAQNGYTGEIGREVTTTTNAFTYISSIAQQVIRGVSVVNIQNTVTQIVNAPFGTVSEGSTINTLITKVNSIITTGTDGITDEIQPNGNISSNANVLAAYSQLQDNKEFLKAEAIAYINANNVGFNYDRVKCKRDVGFLIDCISFDLLRGGNRQSIQAGVYYYGYSTTVSQVPTELPQTAMAYNYMKSVIQAVVQSQELTSFYQSEISQVLDNNNPGNSTAASALGSDIDLIIRLIKVGPDAAPALVPIGQTLTADTGLLNAYELLRANKDFIKAEVIAYVNTLPNFVYSKEKCYRDVGIILENVAYDAMFGGNEKSIESGLSYYNGVTSVIGGQETQTIGAINYIKTLASYIIRNQTCPSVSGYVSKNSQVINYVLTGGGKAQDSLNSAFDIITNIIANGPTAAPTSIAGCAVDPHYMSAEVLLQANRSFIQDEIITYINKSFLNFPFNSAKCRRDSKLIVDALAFDLLYPTTENSQSNFAGLQYWNQGTYTGSIESELSTTLSAIRYLNRLSQKIILNDTSGPRYQEIETQNTSLAPATSVDATSLDTNFSLVIDILQNGTYQVTDKIVPNGTAQTTPGLVHGYNLLLANLDYLKAEVIAFVESIKAPGFTYNQTTCARDVGYITNSMAFDLLHGGNRQAIQAAVTYYSFDSASTAIAGEITETIAAYNYLKDVVTAVVTGSPIARTQGNRITQVTNLPTSTVSQATALSNKLSLIVDIIENGPSSANTLVPISQDISTNIEDQYAFDLLIANRDFIAEEMVAFVNNSYNGSKFSYNKVKCARDTGLIVDSIVTDLLFPGSGYTQSNFAGLQYWNQSGYTGKVGSELTTTTNTINYVSELAQKVVQLDASGTRYQSTVTQITNLPASTLGQATYIKNDFAVITDILVNGATGATDKIISPGVDPLGTDEQRAYNLLQANKAYLEAEAIAYVEFIKTQGFSYDKVKCARDTGLIVDAIVQDMLFSGTSQSTFAGLQYWNQSGYTGSIASELTTTTNAINYVRDIAKKVVRLDTSGSRYSGGTQIINLPAATVTEATTINNDFTVITNILTNGTAGVTDIIVPNDITASTDANTIKAYDLLIANKTYLQGEAVAWVEANKGPGFIYDQAKCYRDVGYMIDSVAFDLLYSGNRQAVQSGVYYYNFNGSSSAIPGESVQTQAAYNHLKNIIPNIIKGLPASRYQNTVNQILDITPATLTEATLAQGKVDVITNIISNGPSVVVSKLPISLTKTTNAGIITAATILEANRDFIQAEITAFIDDQYGAGFEYDQTKCARDVGYMVDSVSFDILYGGNRQAVQSGVCYYTYSSSVSMIENDRSQTTAAYERLRTILPQLLLNDPVTVSTGNTETQITNLPAASNSESTSVQAMVDLITSIINQGPGSANALVPVNLTKSNSVSISKAVDILIANKNFIEAEIIAYVDSTYTTGFTYNKVKCERDTGLIVDGLITDLGWSSNGYTQSNFAGLQYWNQDGYTGAIQQELTTTTSAISYLNTIAQKVIVNNIGGTRYQGGIAQIHNLPPASGVEVTRLNSEFNEILTILQTGTAGVTDIVVSNGTSIVSGNAQNAYNLLQANRAYLQAEVIAYITSQHPGFTYNQSTCSRDVGYMIDSICYDILYGGNRQAIISGVYYYGFSNVLSAIPGERSQTTIAYDRIRDIVESIITNTPIIPTRGNVTAQQFNGAPAAAETAGNVRDMIDLITSIINNGPDAANAFTPVGLTATADTNIQRAMALLALNKNFIKAEVLAYIDKTFSSNYYFNYNQEKCYRDLGLMVDAISQDILLGGNRKTIEAGLTYWTGKVNVIANEVPQTNAALDYLKTVAANVVTNTNFPTLSTSKQLINTYFKGGEYSTSSIDRLVDILKNIISKGPDVAPIPYEGTGVFASISDSYDNVQPASTVLDVTNLGGGRYTLYLSQPMRGFGINSTLYFGQTSVYPALEKNIPDRWAQRKVDPNGSIGGSLVDGAVISDRSPITSFVYDAFTQVNQGGIGVKITNNGYAQLVSVFTIFCSTSVIVDNGGICSITNSNANFGDYCLVSKGYGKRSFFGEVYNPTVLPYYPNGVYPRNQIVEIFSPDPDNRPHIGQIMEVVPPAGYTNNQGLPGFLSAQLSTSTLTTSSITISGIDTTGIVIGQNIYARDQYGSYTDINGDSYIADGTIVTDVNFKSITLSNSISAGGGDLANPNFFTLYVAGNAYYTVLSSTLAPDPIIPGTKLIGADATAQGNDQTSEEVQAINYIKDITNEIISNKLVAAYQTTATQVTNLALGNASQPTVRIGQLFDSLNTIITDGLDAAPTVTKTGTIGSGATDAASLILSNKEFIQAEIIEYINNQYFVYNHATCRRDLGYILDGFKWDVLTGSNYQSIKCGNAYLRNVAGSKYVLEKEKSQTVDAIAHIASLAEGLSGVTSSGAAINTIYNDNLNIASLIEGTSVPTYSLPVPTGLDNGIKSAQSLILNNVEFLKDEVIGYINANYPVFTYDATTCKRDIGYVFAGVEADILLGTNYRSIKSGKAYNRGNANNVLTNELAQTIGAFNFVKNNMLAIDAVSASSTATQTILTDFVNIINILQNGDDVAPTATYTIPPTISAGFDSASVLLQNNRSYIQAEVEAYTYLTFYVPTVFEYDRAKCARDVGVLIDALVYDITYGGNSMSVDAALQYFNSANNNVSFIPNETVQTAAAINYIKTIGDRIIQNLSPAIAYQSSVSQTKNFSLTQGINAVTAFGNLVDDMANIVANGPTAAPAIVQPDTSWATSSVKTAVTAIETAKNLIVSETIQFINDNYTVFNYDPTTCRRDLEYVIYSVMYDLTYGGNWQSVDAALNYYSGTTSLIASTENAATVAAYNYLSYLMKKVAVNTDPETLYTLTAQYKDFGKIDGGNADTTITTLLGYVANIIKNGPTVAPNFVYPGTTGYSAGLLNAYNAINSNKTTLVDSTITYIDNKYNGFEYNQALCKRDVGYIVDAIAADLLTGGNYNTVLCGQSYYARAGTHHFVTIEDNVTDPTLFTDKTLVNFYQRSYMSASGYLFEYVGAGSNYGALPQVGRADPIQERETIQLNNGKVFFTSTDQNGDFRIGPGLVISQATGVLSGRTFTKSLFANLTPFILAIEGI
jgi:hypothetical protein